jgi:response regulator RpfG family c-di-GMP phosphodiesterase
MMMDEKIATLARDVQHIRSDQEAMKSAIERMSEAVTRLAIIEERQAASSHAIERVMATVEKIDERVRALEKAETIQNRTAEWIERAMWAAASAAAVFVAHKAGLF